MRNFFVLANAIEYIEQNLDQSLGVEEIASACYCSVSALQKLFRFALHLCVKEYVDKRRLTEAANDLLQSNVNITEIAFRYRYNSAETFTRAFVRVWGETPSSFRKTKRFSGLFPRVYYEYERGIDLHMARKVDISDLYNVLSGMKETYVLCFDVTHMTHINEISRAAGDQAILTVVRRIEKVIDEKMVLFRIGGDEFAVVTGLKEEHAAKKLANRIIEENGRTFCYLDQEIPLSVWVSSVRIPSTPLRYNELFDTLHETIENGKTVAIQIRHKGY